MRRDPAARAALRQRGWRLILDHVPNHVAPDHRAVLADPSWFIQGDADDLALAMLMTNEIFARAWDAHAGTCPSSSAAVELRAFYRRLLAVAAGMRRGTRHCSSPGAGTSTTWWPGPGTTPGRTT